MNIRIICGIGAFLAGASILPAMAHAAACTASKDLFVNPFNKDSAHHRPIGTGAQYASDSDPTTIALRRAGFNNINSDNGWGLNIYRATASDPVKTVTNAGPYNGGIFPVTLHIPGNVQNGNVADSVVVIYDEPTKTAHEFFYWRWNNGKPTAAIHRVYSATSKGHTQPGGAIVGTSASGMSTAFGILRGAEFNTPGIKIQHALQMAVDARGSCGMMLGQKIVWPASSKDGFCSKAGNCTGPLSYGSLLAIPPGVNVTKLGLSEPGARLAQALKEYGVYVVDNSQCPIMRADQYLNNSVRSKLITDMRKLYPLLRQIKNNVPGQIASGGGTPLAPNCAFDATGGSASSSGGSSSSSGSSSGGSSSGGGAAGKCGSANGQTFATTPNENRCVGKIAKLRNLKTTATGWTWQCAGDPGAPLASCSAKKQK